MNNHHDPEQEKEARKKLVKTCLKHCLHEVVENSNSDLYHSIGEDCPTVIANLLEDMK